MNRDRSVEELALELLGKDAAELRPAERRVIESIRNRATISTNVARIADQQASLGARLADRVAAVGGSWGFIAGFAIVLFGWMLLNSGVLARWGLAFDPYPYIFLNLMLSMLAAIQAPIIMMSQNRLAENDRIAARHDYEVNLRAELDIRQLHEKVDGLAARLVGIERALERLAESRA